MTGLFDPELVAALPKSIKFIIHNGAGYDQIDTKACSENGILVSNTPQAVDSATADVAMFLLLGAMRKAWIGQSAIRVGDFRGRTPLGHDPEGKTLGVLGMGGIGSALAKRAVAFGMRVQYHNRKPVPDVETAIPAKYVELDELLSTSDVISIHLPLNEATRHFIGKERLRKMKKGVTIVNTARGAIIDEEALVEVLEQDDHIWSVGLDVYEDEPKVHPKLLANENVMLTPHIGTVTSETQVCSMSDVTKQKADDQQKKMEILAIDNVRSAIQHNRLLTPVNKL